jgi:hypothetical protein
MPITTEEEARAIREIDMWPLYHFDEPGTYRPPVSLSYGGGVNSTAMAIAFVQRGLPLDIICFSDTGGERPETLAYIERFSEWLQSKGYPKVEHLRYTDKDGNRLTLEENCLNKEILPSLSYGYKKCSLRWKVGPLDKYHNNNDLAQECWERGYKVIKLLGYDAGEGRRVDWADEEDDKYEYGFPLYHLGLNRRGCEDLIEEAGLPSPGKSACFFCPATKKHEIKALANDHPDLMERAIQMEENAMENLKTIKGLGRSFSWKKFLEADAKQQELFPDPTRGTTPGCMCWD